MGSRDRPVFRDHHRAAERESHGDLGSLIRSLSRSKHVRHRRGDAHAGLQFTAGANIHGAFPDLGRAKNLSPIVPARAERGRDHEFWRVQSGEPISAQFPEHHSQFCEELWYCHSRADACRASGALAAPDQGQSDNAQDRIAWTENAGAA